MRTMAEQVERWEAGECGLDEAELKARIEALDSDTALPEPLAAALGALSGGLQASHAAMHPDQDAESPEAGENKAPQTTGKTPRP
ncbi:MAG: hypothetical protein ACOCWR_06255 [Oceanidesulfovibrio sp.]